MFTLQTTHLKTIWYISFLKISNQTRLILTEVCSTCWSSTGINSTKDGLESGSFFQHDVIISYLKTIYCMSITRKIILNCKTWRIPEHRTNELVCLSYKFLENRKIIEATKESFQQKSPYEMDKPTKYEYTQSMSIAVSVRFTPWNSKYYLVEFLTLNTNLHV